jgi:hypothetical protein
MSVKLDVVWQEWQIVSRARLLFVDAISLAKQRRLIEKNLRLFKQRYERSYQAMQAGNEVLPTVASDLVALNAAETQLNDIDQFVLKNKHDLNALLGLTPDAELQPAREPASSRRRRTPVVVAGSRRAPPGSDRATGRIPGAGGKGLAGCGRAVPQAERWLDLPEGPYRRQNTVAGYYHQPTNLRSQPG